MPCCPNARRIRAAWIVAASFVALSGAHAQDTTPIVAPDRLEDVPSTRIDPFPAFDNFAWRAFIALNWPSRLEPERRGEPDRAKSLADPGPRVWETFKARYEALPRDANGAPVAPAPWASYASPHPCGSEFAAESRVVAAYEPYAEFDQAGFTPGRRESPLVARNRTYVRYEVRINREHFETILEHRLWQPENAPTAEAPVAFRIGAIAVKAAWRVLDDSDTFAVRARYYVARDVAIVDVAASRQAGAPRCRRHDLALVGFHIAIKTRYRPQWIWSTFEHVDNVPPVGVGEAREPDARDADAPYAFNDPALPQGKVWPPEDSAAAQPLSAANPPSLAPEPTQLVRKHPIRPQTMAMNRAYWGLPELRGTVWSHYMLTATQWPTVPMPPGPDNDGRYFPGLRIDPDTPDENYQSSGANEPEFNLVNVTMESYAQDQPSSCMACHHAAANARGRDFVGILPGSN